MPPGGSLHLQDFLYHGIAAFFYLSASVVLAKVTLDMKGGSSLQNYHLDISAVVSHMVLSQVLNIKEVTELRHQAATQAAPS